MSCMEIIDNFRIQCDECGEKYLIDKDSLDVDSVCIGEGGMGSEIEHDFIGEFRCGKCGNWISFKVMGYEYPEGAYNSHGQESRGCTFLDQPMVDMKWDDYEFQYPYDIEEQLYTVVNNVERNIQAVLDDPNSVYNMSPSGFEDMVAEIFQRKGFNVKITPRTRDGGKDIIASYNMGGIPCMIIIECKRYAPDRKVGVSVVRALHGTQMKEHYGKAVVVTSSSFSRDARKFANDLRDMVILVDFEELIEMLNDTLVT